MSFSSGFKYGWQSLIFKLSFLFITLLFVMIYLFALFSNIFVSRLVGKKFRGMEKRQKKYLRRIIPK